MPGAVPSALHILTPESSKQPPKSRVQDGEGICSGRPLSTGAAGVLMLLPPLPVLPPKWTGPLFKKKKKSLFIYLAVVGLHCIAWDLFSVALGLCTHGMWA